MKFSIALLFLLLSTLITRAVDDEAEVRQFMNAWVESFNKNEHKTISAFYEVDERVDMLISVGLSRRGHKSIAASYESDMKEVRFYGSESEEMMIRVYDKTALVSFVHRFKYEVLEDRSHRQIHIRTTITLRHTDAGWRIVMEHSSPINGIERSTILEK